MKVAAPLFTRAEYERLPEGFPAQLVRGELVKKPAPVPYHQALVRDLYERLARAAGQERVLFSPVDVFLDEPMCQVHSLPANCPAHEPS
ncbi:MAG: hypothetical protein ACYTDY_08935 [Planctomycetota bacterium]